MIGERERPSVAEEIQIPTGTTQDPFASAVRATRMPMVITDPRQSDNPIVFCNDAFTRLTGYGRDEILGRNCRFLQGPATREADVAAVRAAVAERTSVEVDIQNYRKDGTTFWNALLISPVFVDGELAYFFASQMDVTDRKRAEEHSFLLNRELDHRVKNTLATVQTLVLQTLKDASVPAEVSGAVAGRLQALARSHDVLTREAWASALMADVIEGALEPTRASAGERITVEGPDLRLRPRIATMLSLAIHELGDNAEHHGSLSNAKGTVSVRWVVADGRLHLRWQETGGPPVSRPERPGYGVRIVERVLAAEFGGTARIDFAPDGIVFDLEAPAEGLGVERTAWTAP
jgi:PAS domain S-box-containing protein